MEACSAGVKRDGRVCGFGVRGEIYPEDILVLAAALKLERPVKWIEDRREHFVSTTQERDQFWDMEIATDNDGRILGLRGLLIHEHGAYTARGINLPQNSAETVPLQYEVPAYRMNVRVALTNKVPVTPVRGAGHPQGTFVIERLLDRVAREGVLCTHAFNPAPSCSPCRASLLTGKYPHQLGERANLWSGFPQDTPVFTQLLRAAGYELGFNGKPWGPGSPEASGWKENPVGPSYKDFDAFLAKRPVDRPFFYWIGNTDTATRGGKTPFLADAEKAGLKAEAMVVPPELPDCAETRQDLLNYYGGIARLDQEAARAVAALERSGELERTVIEIGRAHV